MRYSSLGGCSTGLSWIGSMSLVIMMVLTVIDVAGRYLFNTPILGAFEVTENLVLVLTFSYIGYAQKHQRHVAVSVVVDRMPHKLRYASILFNQGVGLILFILITVMSSTRAIELIHIGETSPNLAIPNYPFVLFLSLGSLVMCFEYLRNIVVQVRPGKMTRP